MRTTKQPHPLLRRMLLVGAVALFLLLVGMYRWYAKWRGSAPRQQPTTPPVDQDPPPMMNKTPVKNTPTPSNGITPPIIRGAPRIPTAVAVLYDIDGAPWKRAPGMLQWGSGVKWIWGGGEDYHRPATREVLGSTPLLLSKEFQYPTNQSCMVCAYCDGTANISLNQTPIGHTSGDPTAPLCVSARLRAGTNVITARVYKEGTGFVSGGGFICVVIPNDAVPQPAVRTDATWRWIKAWS